MMREILTLHDPCFLLGKLAVDSLLRLGFGAPIDNLVRLFLNDKVQNLADAGVNVDSITLIQADAIAGHDFERGLTDRSE